MLSSGRRPPLLHKAVSMGKELLLPPCVSPSIAGTYSCHGIDHNLDKINQDAACIAYPLGGDPAAALFLVLDGHGAYGHHVTEEAVERLHAECAGYSWRTDRSTAAAQLTSAFEATQQHLRHYEHAGRIPAAESGACAVAAVVCANRLSIAHAGDVRAVLGARSDGTAPCAAPGHGASAVAESPGCVWDAILLTEDHTPELPDERRRLEQSGAVVVESRYEGEPDRIYARVDTGHRRGPGLAMSRSLGDLDGDEIGIVATPTVSHRMLGPSDAFVVIASDGVWEFLPTEHVVQIVSGFFERGEPAESAARFLIAKAALMWKVEEGDYRDDITAIVLYLNGGEQWEKVRHQTLCMAD